MHKSAELAAAGLVFMLLQNKFPSVPGQKFIRKDTVIDIAYVFIGTFIAVPAATLLLSVAIVFFYLNPKELGVGYPLAEFALLYLAALLFLDFVAYWIHRWFHGRSLWKFHAIHHSSREIDWLSGPRFHPAENIAVIFMQFLALTLAGVPGSVIAAAMMTRGLHGYFVHANLRWDLGPFKYVIASPVFHRWHHTMEDRGRDKNFAGVFPAWDLIFGTFYMPEGEQPGNFGVSEDVGGGLAGQLAFPFREKEKTQAVAGD